VTRETAAWSLAKTNSCAMPLTPAAIETAFNAHAVDGIITQEAAFKVRRALGITDALVENVKRTFKEADEDKTGKLNKRQCRKFVAALEHSVSLSLQVAAGIIG
jgi:hypothetical protein